ncbi:MAG: hypothetical protein II836_00560, partial [Clostridia bacterium]|nr:hypothetical protein [Clostridia bacterium]
QAAHAAGGFAAEVPRLSGEVAEHVDYIQLLSDASEMRFHYNAENRTVDIPLPVYKPLGAEIPVLEIYLK